MSNFVKNNRKLLIILGIIFGIITVAGVTYAMYRKVLVSNFGASGYASNLDEYVVYTKGTQNIYGTMLPGNSYTDGQSVTVTFYKNSSAPSDIYGNIYIDVNGISSALTSSEVLKYTVVDNTDSSIIGEGSFYGKDSGSILAVANMDLNNSYTLYSVYIWLDSNLFSTDMSSSTFNVNIRCNASYKRYMTAAETIRNLYLDNRDSRVTSNSISYQRATSVGLMNDRLGNANNGIDDGNVRYYGANPNNYIWLGDNYESAFNFTSNGVSTTRASGSKKLWRIIGVFDGRLKVITADPITTTSLAYDTSINNTTGGNSGYGINQWGETEDTNGDPYNGADLMRLLNPGYEYNKDLDSSGNLTLVNNSLYWNRASGKCYNARSNGMTTCSFTNTGLSDSEKSKIDTVTWKLGAYNSAAVYVDAMYLKEIGTDSPKSCSSGNNCNDNIVRTTSWEGKVGLMHLSDYGYAADLNSCNVKVNAYNDANCADNWLKDTSAYQRTITPSSYTSSAAYTFYVGTNGSTGATYAQNPYRVRPVVYLKSNLIIASGSGTFADPYVLG